MASLGKITAELELKFKDFVDGMGKAEDSVEDLGDEMDTVRKGPGAKLDKWFRGAALIGVAKYGTDLFNLGVEVEQWGRAYETTFGDVSGALDTFIADHNTRFGVAEERLRGFAAETGTFLKGLGFDEGEAADFTQDLLDLAGAISEFTGVDVETALEALTAGVGGRFEQLQALGITIDKADVDALLAKDGMGELAGQAEDMAAALAILDLAVADSEGAIEQYELGMGDALEAQRNWEATWDQLKANLGTFVTAFAPAIQAAADLVQGLMDLVGPELLGAFGTGMLLLAFKVNPLLAALGAAFTLAAQFRGSNFVPGAGPAPAGIPHGLASTFGFSPGGGSGGGATQRASGGPLSAGQASLVGEQGPEIFVPRQAGTVIPNGGMGGGVTVIVEGSVISEGDLVEAVRRGLRADTIRGGSMEFA